MKHACLGEVATLVSGGTPTREVAEYFGAGVPWASIGDLNDSLVKETKEALTTTGLANSAAKVVPPGTVLVAMYGASIGKLGVAGTSLCTNQAIAAIQPRCEDLDSRYLYHFLLAQRQHLRARGRGGAQPNISLGDLKNWVIPLRPMDEQRRIAAILDHADALRTKQRRVIAKLDHLTRAVFAAMFSTSPSSPRWPTVRLGDVVPTIDSGSSPVCENRKALNGEWGILKLGAISYGVFNPNENKAFIGDPASLRKIEVQPGDLLFSRKNTKELVGATAIAYETPPLLLLPDLIFRLNLDRDRVDAEYLHALLRSPETRPAVVALASGSASSMSNISKARLVELPIELPPIELQHAYSERVRMVNGLRDKGNRVLTELDDLFRSLQSRVFSGQLR